jgi:prepilin-type N-terminal cleavage/methylation domain-containing protein
MRTGRRLVMIRRNTTARGFTMVEVMVASAIALLVMVAVVELQVLTARAVKDFYGTARARSERMVALNQIRFRLSDARIGSCVVSDGGHRIQFVDPTIGNVRSEFNFVADEATLYYDMDTSDLGGQRAVAEGPIDVTFTLGSTHLDAPDYAAFAGTDSIVTVYAKTSSDVAYGDVDLRDGETVVYLRNP